MRPKTFQRVKKFVYIIVGKAVTLKSENRRTMKANKYSKTDNEYAIPFYLNRTIVVQQHKERILRIIYLYGKYMTKT